MTLNEFRKLQLELHVKETKLIEDLLPRVRAAINVLRDAGHPSTAVSLEVTMSELDQNRANVIALARDNADVVTEWIGMAGIWKELLRGK